MRLPLSRDFLINTDTVFSGWFIKYRWWIIGSMGFALLGLEIAELIFRGFNLVDSTEIFFYSALTGIIATLVEMLLRFLGTQKHMVEIMNSRHKLSMELSTHETWETLIAFLAKFPGDIAPIQSTSLFVRNPVSGRFELGAAWNNGIDKQKRSADFLTCQGCLKRQSKDEFLARACSVYEKDQSNCHGFCILISFGYELIGILQFSLEPGKQLSKGQKDVIWNVREEMAIALKSGMDRKRLSELQLEQAALSERREVSHFLHDNLNQNLGYIRMKLDQWLTTTEDPISLYDIRPDLERMQEAADQSYEQVRGKLESLRKKTMPFLTNLLIEHANKVSKRAYFGVTFETSGKPVPLAPEIQQALFYAFQEALGNIEKHASANKVEVQLVWGKGKLSVLIKDNGRGFDPDTIQTNKHFGIQIMLERINKIYGRIEFTSSENAGTTVLISVPLLVVKVEKMVNA